MIVTLHRKQQISVDSRVRFQHRADSGRRYEVVLSKRQFQNLHDAIVNRDKFSSLRHLPLGGSLWLFRKDDVTKIIDNNRRLFFSFYASAWHFYVSSVHHSLYEYICNGKSYHHKSHAQHESQSTHSSRRISSVILGQHKTVSRSTGNVGHENDKRSKHSMFPRREGSDPRPDIRHGSRKYESRIHQEIKADQEDAKFSTDEDDSIEFSDECSIEEEYMSSEDRID